MGEYQDRNQVGKHGWAFPAPSAPDPHPRPTRAQAMAAVAAYEKVAHDCGRNLGKHGLSVSCELTKVALRDIIRALTPGETDEYKALTQEDES